MSECECPGAVTVRGGLSLEKLIRGREAGSGRQNRKQGIEAGHRAGELGPYNDYCLIA